MIRILICLLTVLFSMEAMACPCDKFRLTTKDLDQYAFIAYVEVESILKTEQVRAGEEGLVFDISFNIKRLYKGTFRSRLTVYGGHLLANNTETSCDIHIKPNEEWLLFGSLNPEGQLRTGYCQHNVRHKTSDGEVNLRSNVFQKRTALIEKQLGFDNENEEILNGHIFSNYPDGMVEIDEYYENGHLVGSRKVYYPNGSLMINEIYKDGKRHGQQKLYYQTGELRKEYNYQNGKPINSGYWYYKNGTIRDQDTFYKQGMLLSRHHYDSTKQHLYTLSYDTLSVKYKINRFDSLGIRTTQSILTGNFRRLEFNHFYESGKLLAQWQYIHKDARTTRVWKKWTESGVLIGHRVFKDGKVTDIVEEEKLPDK